MKKEPIITELRKIRDAHAAKFNYNFAAIAEDWLKEVVIFAALTGMRRGEILNLRWEQIDLQRRIIFIQSSLAFKTKQGKRRVMPMSDIVYSLLRAIRVRFRETE